MKNLPYILLGLAIGYFVFKRKKKRYSISQSIETLSEDQFKKLTSRVGEFPNYN